MEDNAVATFSNICIQTGYVSTSLYGNMETRKDIWHIPRTTHNSFNFYNNRVVAYVFCKNLYIDENKMSKETLLLLSAITASPFIGVWIKGIFDKKKTDAETHNVNVSGELNIGKYGMDMANQWRSDFDKLSLRFENLERKFDSLKKDKEKLEEENIEKDIQNRAYKKRIGELEVRVSDLEKLVEHYKNNQTA